ncbi:MAG: hypothetical protein JW984_12050 [Deltaproteobacteria bacterium]|uniref:ApeA N-terminal domain-containing protein n=1 Tax=Candidatus Zymogenus saltonus TaxID=2844893 RepID=A0A9D8PR25_9DELT|nr:hypothetical protein [Candidatus Zymogenus saltonus]
MINSFEIEGEWWLPENPDNKVKGKLIYNPGQTPILDLSGVLSSLNVKEGKTTRLALGELISKDFILGISNSGEKATLHKCYSINPTTIIKDIVVEKQTFDIQYIFRGEHFNNKDDIKFQALVLKYLYFDTWTKSYTRREGSKIKFIKIDIREDLNLYFVLQNNVELPINELNNLENIENSIILHPKESKKYFDYDDDMGLMFMFFSFAISNRTHPLSIRGLTDNHDEVEVFFRIRGITNLPETLVEKQFLFSLRSIQIKIEYLIVSWFKKGSQLELELDIVFSLFLRTIYFPEMHYEIDFLVIAQAIETFHHRISYNKKDERYEEDYVSDDNYNKICKKLYEALDEEIPNINDKSANHLKQHLIKYLELGNKYSLRKRLKEIERKYRLMEVFFSCKSQAPSVQYVLSGPPI